MDTELKKDYTEFCGGAIQVSSSQKWEDWTWRNQIESRVKGVTRRLPKNIGRK